MNDRTPGYRKFFAEVKRRGVFKMAAVYGAVAFAVLQGADIVFPSLGLPDKSLTVVVVVALLGFPIAIALAWAYEVTGQGVRLEDPASSSELEAMAAEPRSRRWLAGLVALVAVVLMVGTGWLILTRGQSTAGDGSDDASSTVARVVVLPFTVRGTEHEYLSEGMVDILSRKLDVAGELRGVDPRAVLALAQDEGEPPGPVRGREIARRLQADFFVLGAILELDGRLQIDASLYDAERDVEAITQATAGGDPGDVMGIVDDLAAQLLLSSGGRGGPVAHIAAVTTDSLAALKEYLQGERALRAGEYLTAAEAFQRAVSVDSAFALAWYRLSVAYEWLTRDHLVRESAAQAFRHAGRLSEHDRLLLQAAVAARGGDHVLAEQLYRSIVGSYPDDTEAWFQLGEVLFHYAFMTGRRIAVSREAFERVLNYEPDHMNTLIHVARIVATDHDPTELNEITDQFLELNPEADRAIEMRALRAFATDDSAEIARVLTDLRRVSDPALLTTVAYVPVMAADVEAGLTMSSTLTGESRIAEMRALGHVYRAYLLMAKGQFSAAVDQFETARTFGSTRATEFGAIIPLLPFFPASDDDIVAMRNVIRAFDPDTVAPITHPSGFLRGHNEVHRHLKPFLLGLLNARLGNASDSERYAAELETSEKPLRSPTLPEDLSLGIRAYVAWQSGESAEGLSLLENAPMQTYYQNAFRSPYYSFAILRYLRAMFLEDLGREEEALIWFGSFEEISIYDLVFVAPALLRRAEIYDRLGDREAARRHYARFIELWADCDPELRPEVDRAERRLAELAGEPGPG
jgi:tetratricopeptide (TPR) repeat protein